MIRVLGRGFALAILLVAQACAVSPERCAICHMAVPADTHTMATIDGVSRILCDPRCAKTYHEQTGTVVALERVTDFRRREALDPRRAVYVIGSDTAPDVQKGQRSGSRAWPAAQTTLEWHRCLPSILAFSTSDAAFGHVRDHGGRLATYDDLKLETAPARAPRTRPRR